MKTNISAITVTMISAGFISKYSKPIKIKVLYKSGKVFEKKYDSFENLTKSENEFIQDCINNFKYKILSIKYYEFSDLPRIEHTTLFG